MNWLSNIELVDDWKDAHKWYSTRAMGLAATIQTTWLTIPESLQDRFPDGAVTGITAFLLIAGIAGRMVQQKIDE